MTGAEQPKDATQRFSENLEDFFNLIIQLVQETRVTYPDLLGWDPEPLRSLYKLMKVYKPEDIMRLWVSETHMHWGDIKERKHEFFAVTRSLLEKTNTILPVKDLNPAILTDMADRKTAEGTYLISRENMDVVWSYWDAFVTILIDHVHTTRKPKTRLLPDGKRQAVYTAKYVPQFDIQGACRVWKVDLRF
jgi:hypothetical protein